MLLAFVLFFFLLMIRKGDIIIKIKKRTFLRPETICQDNRADIENTVIYRKIRVHIWPPKIHQYNIISYKEGLLR